MFDLLKIWAYFIYQFIPSNFSKILVREDHYEGSANLAFSNGMKFIWQPHMTKSLASSKIQLFSLSQMSATSRFSFWTRLCIFKGSAFIFDSIATKFGRNLVLSMLNPCDMLVTPYILHFDLHFLSKSTVKIFFCKYLPLQSFPVDPSPISYLFELWSVLLTWSGIHLVPCARGARGDHEGSEPQRCSASG